MSNEKINFWQKKGNTLSTTLLVTGICVGSSCFGIPIVTISSGFIPGLVMTAIVWFLSICFAMLYLEVALAHKDGTNLISFCRNLLGTFGVIIAIITFAVNVYAFLTGYCIISSEVLSDMTQTYLSFSLPKGLIIPLTSIIGGLIVFCGVFVTDRFNFVLVCALFLSFILTLISGTEHIILKRLLRYHWIYFFLSVPILFNTFTFQMIIPTIATHLKQNTKKLIIAIFVGTFLSLIIIMLWQWLVIGAIPQGALWTAYEESFAIKKIVPLLQKYFPITYLVNFVFFFAVVTSLLGNGISAVDFLSDAVHIPLKERIGMNRFWVCLAIFIPPIFFGLVWPNAFLFIITYLVGPFGVIILMGVLPLWLVISARYFRKIKTSRLLPGGRIALFLLGVVIFFIFYLEGIAWIR